MPFGSEKGDKYNVPFFRRDPWAVIFHLDYDLALGIHKSPDFHLWVFHPRKGLGCVLAFLIAWGTVAGHAYRVARANPIHALRYE